LLSGLTDDEVDALYPTERLDGLTPKSITSRTELRRQLATVRRRGYATSSEESEAGVSSVAVALHTPNGPRLAINVAVPTSRMTREDEKRIGAALIAVADRATVALHG
jgi:DNA-binding IclR family transcriptional regulator